MDAISYTAFSNEDKVELRDNEIYTVKQAAYILKIHPQTMSEMCRKGFVRAAKVSRDWRIRGDEIIRLSEPVNLNEVGEAK